MDNLQNCMLEYLDRIGCKYRQEETQSLYTFAVKGKNGVYPVLLYAKAPFLVCIARLSLAIPDENRLEVAEYLHRVNYGLLLGNFEMDYDEGEVRFRTALMTEDIQVHQNVLERYIQTPATMLDKYTRGIYAIVYDGEIAQLAMQDIKD